MRRGDALGTHCLVFKKRFEVGEREREFVCWLVRASKRVQCV